MNEEQVKTALFPPSGAGGNMPSNILSRAVSGIGNITTTQTAIPDDDDLDDDDDDLDEDKDLNKDKDKDKNKDIDKDKDLDTNKDKDKNQDDNTNDSIISFLGSKFGEIEGDFTEDEDGLALYTEKLIEAKVKAAKEEAQEELLESSPIVKALKEHIDAGYGIESFMQQTQIIDWDKVKIEDKDGEIIEATAKEIFWMARQVKKWEKEDIEEAWNLAKDSGKIKDKVTSDVVYLKKAQDKIIADTQAREKKANQAIIDAEKEEIKEIESILKTKKLLGFEFDDNQIKELKKFALEKDKKGLTERDKRIEKMTTEESLLLDMLLKNNFKDLGVKAKPEDKTSNAFKNLKTKIAEKKSVNLNNVGGNSGNNIAVKDVRTLFNKN